MSFKKRKIWKILSIGLFGIIPIVASSCASTSVAQKLIDKSISLGNGDQLSSNISLKDYASTALKSDSGMKAYLEAISAQLALDWIKRVSDSGNVQEYKDSYTKEVKSINDGWSDTKDSYKTDYGTASDLKLQQVELDPNGGTVDSYKQTKLNSWALDTFKTYLFSKDYLTYKMKDNSNNVVPNSSVASSSISDLYDALSRSAFVFGYAETDTVDINTINGYTVNVEYANFINYIWEKYVEIMNPYVVNMSLWKYGTPSLGWVIFIKV